MSEANKEVGKEASKGQEKKGKGIKKKILTVLLVIVIVAGGIGGYQFYEQSQYFTTENAKVTAEMYYITPLSSGELIEWNVSEGDVVEKNQQLGRMSTLPYMVSPIDGTVVTDNVMAGQMVSTSTTLAIVADTNHTYIGVNIEETDIANIEVGQEVDVTIDAYPGMTFKGVVTKIDLTTQTFFSGTTSFSTSGTYTKVTQLVPVKVVIDNPENVPMQFGMNATVKVHIASPVTEEAKTAATAKEVARAEESRVYSSAAEAVDQISVISMVAGKVNNIFKGLGDQVAAGDTLFTLDDSDRVLAVNQADANYRIALASYDNTLKSSNSKSSVIPLENAYDLAKDNYDRVKALYDQGGVTTQALESAEASMSSAKAQLDATYQSLDAGLVSAKAAVDAAEATLEIAKKNLAECTVVSPMSGIIAEKSISVGDMVSSQIIAMSIIDDSEMTFNIDVTENEIKSITNSSNASVYIQALENTFEGKVTRIAPTSDEETGLFEVEVTVNNADAAIKAGMTANVTIN